jgi:hypothetical protein
MSAHSCTIGHEVADRPHAELARSHRDPGGHRRRRGEIWDGSPGVKVGMVDVAALPDFAEATPARRAALRPLLCDRARGDPAGQPVADLSGLLHLRPARRADLRVPRGELPLVPAGARLADGAVHDLRDRRAHRADPLARAAQVRSGHLLDLSAASTCANGWWRWRPR